MVTVNSDNEKGAQIGMEEDQTETSTAPEAETGSKRTQKIELEAIGARPERKGERDPKRKVHEVFREPVSALGTARVKVPERKVHQIFRKKVYSDEALQHEQIDDNPGKALNVFLAAAQNDIKSLKLALKYYDVNARDEHGMTPLHHAASGLASDAIDLLLERGGDPCLLDKFEREPGTVAHEVWRTAGLEVSEKLMSLSAQRRYKDPDATSHPSNE